MKNLTDEQWHKITRYIRWIILTTAGLTLLYALYQDVFGPVKKVNLPSATITPQVPNPGGIPDSIFKNFKIVTGTVLIGNDQEQEVILRDEDKFQKTLICSALDKDGVAHGHVKIKDLQTIIVLERIPVGSLDRVPVLYYLCIGI